jgi:hypothetical protein
MPLPFLEGKGCRELGFERIRGGQTNRGQRPGRTHTRWLNPAPSAQRRRQERRTNVGGRVATVGIGARRDGEDKESLGGAAGNTLLSNGRGGCRPTGRPSAPPGFLPCSLAARTGFLACSPSLVVRKKGDGRCPEEASSMGGAGAGVGEQAGLLGRRREGGRKRRQTCAGADWVGFSPG